jgi:lipopolysaccharide transport system permease protein
VRTYLIDSRPPKLVHRLAELWAYRELLLLLTWRDLRVRYAQTFVGLLWVLLQPAVTLALFIVVFGRVIKVDTGTTPYAAFALPAIVAWNYFSAVLRESGSVILQSASMVSKVYFPRLILPLAKTLTSGVELLIGLVLVFILLTALGIRPPLHVIWLPAWLMLALCAALGTGLLVAASTIRYRDVQHVLPFVVQIGLYASPIAWPIQLVPEPWRMWLYLNPMTGVAEGLRWSLLPGSAFPGLMAIGFSAATGLALLILGLAAFGRAERRMADWV